MFRPRADEPRRRGRRGDGLLAQPHRPPWFGQTAVSRNGDAAQTGPAGDGGESTLQAEGAGPAVLWFAARVSSETDRDLLRFVVDGTPREEWSGERGWLFRNIPLAAGAHTLQWRYAKDAAGAAGSDCAWVDEVRFTPLVVLETALDMDPAVFPVTTDGAAGWRFGQTVIVTYPSGGDDAAQSAPITHGEHSGLQAPVAGPGVLAFSRWSSTEYIQQTYISMTLYTKQQEAMVFF